MKTKKNKPLPTVDSLTKGRLDQYIWTNQYHNWQSGDKSDTRHLVMTLVLHLPMVALTFAIPIAMLAFANHLLGTSDNAIVASNVFTGLAILCVLGYYCGIEKSPYLKWAEKISDLFFVKRVEDQMSTEVCSLFKVVSKVEGSRILVSLLECQRHSGWRNNVNIQSWGFSVSEENQANETITAAKAIADEANYELHQMAVVQEIEQPALQLRLEQMTTAF